MFYIAGFVLYAAIIALIAQYWSEGAATRILLSAGIGAVFWCIAVYFITTPKASDIRRGITNSLLLTGSLLLIAGGFIITNEYVDFDDVNFYAVAITLLALGGIHISFGWQIKRNLIILIGLLLTVTSFPALVFGMLTDFNIELYIYCLVTAASAALLAYATRVVFKLKGDPVSAGRVFDPLAAFTVLMSFYVASYDDSTGLFWLLALVIGIIGLFYLSIVTQNKFLLGNGSFFLVLSIITISFRYFSDSPGVSLLISAAGLLGTAVAAAHINRRYIK